MNEDYVAHLTPTERETIQKLSNALSLVTTLRTPVRTAVWDAVVAKSAFKYGPNSDFYGSVSRLREFLTRTPQDPCDGKVVEIDGKQYQLKKV